MTVVLGYVNSFMSVIMSDDRTNWGKNQEFGYDDGHTKLLNLSNMGWASGAGLSSYLDELKKNLAVANITNVNDIKVVYRDVLERCKKNEPKFEEFIDESLAVISWIGVVEELPHFRVGLLSNKHFGDKIKIIDNGYIFIAYPGDYLEDRSKVEAIERKFNLHIGEEIEFNVILEEMLKVFDEITLNSPLVSRSCDIGIQLLQPDGIYKTKVSGDVLDLLRFAKNKETESKLEIISVNKF